MIALQAVAWLAQALKGALGIGAYPTDTPTNLALVNVSATVAILCKLEARTTPAGVRACSVDTISERTASETRRIYLLKSG